MIRRAAFIEHRLGEIIIPAGVRHISAEAFYSYRAGCPRKVRFLGPDTELEPGIFGYDLHRSLADIRPTYDFDVSCQGSVPEAIIAFMEGETFEEVVRLAVSLGGDSDTIACMAGAIAACCYSIPEEMAERCSQLLTDDLRETMERFVAVCG